MSENKAFLDTSIRLRLLSANEIKAGKAEDIIASSGIFNGWLHNTVFREYAERSNHRQPGHHPKSFYIAIN